MTSCPNFARGLPVKKKKTDEKMNCIVMSAPNRSDDEVMKFFNDNNCDAWVIVPGFVSVAATKNVLTAMGDLGTYEMKAQVR